MTADAPRGVQPPAPSQPEGAQESLGELFLTAGRAMLATARRDPSARRFDCDAGSAIGLVPTPDDLRNLEDVEVLYVLFAVTAGVEAAMQPGRKIHGWGGVLPDGRVRWHRVIATRSPHWNGDPHPLADAPDLLRNAVEAQLDPQRSHACRLDEGAIEFSHRVCAMKAPNSSWEESCRQNDAREHDESQGSCATLTEPKEAESPQIGIKLGAALGAHGKQKGMLRASEAFVRRGQLCLRGVTVSW